MLSTERTMRNIQPTAELPLVHVPLTNAMPTRPPKGPTRNLTGIFLGSESRHAPQGVKHAVPPLARGRGMPSGRVRTPTEQRRYRKVEVLRMKDEKRGFTGKPLKKPNTPKETSMSPRVTNLETQEPDFWELTKQNARHFTASTNSGVTHFELLAPDGSDFYQDSFPPADEELAEELRQASIAQRELVGIVDCYKKVCRGNVDALLDLLPQKRTPQNKGRQSTGFTVKSYRNPKQAEIIATFPPPQTPRPRTSATGYGQRPYVPAPYFFKSYQPPKTTGGQLQGQDFNPYSESSIISHPGAGHFPHSVTRRKLQGSSRVQTPVIRVSSGKRETSPLAPTSTPIASRSQADFSQPPVRESKVEVAIPRVGQAVSEKEDLQAAGKKSSEEDKTEPEAHQDNGSAIAHCSTSQDNSSESNAEKTQEAKMNSEGQELNTAPSGDQTKSDSGAENETAAKVELRKQGSNSEICIELKDEAGKQKPVEIDVADDGPNVEQLAESVEVQEDCEPHAGRRVSITERVLKSRNSEQQLKILTKTAEERKKELAELLTEHAQIVHRVSSMEEVASPSADKENSTFQSDFPEDRDEKNNSH